MPDIEHIAIEDVPAFVAWLLDLKVGKKQVAIITGKMELLKAHGLDWGDEYVKRIDGNLHELKYNHYRLYFRHEPPIARFVHYGIKATQMQDIRRAQGSR